MARLRLSGAARRDLENIQDYGLERFGLAAVTAHMAGFGRLFGLLREHPMAGQLLIDQGTAMRSLSHRPHRIVYRVATEEVLIVRILHAAQDVTLALGRER